MNDQRHWGMILVATDCVPNFEACLPPDHSVIATRPLDDGVDECIVSGPDMPMAEDDHPITRITMGRINDEAGAYYFWAHLGPLHRWRVG